MAIAHHPTTILYMAVFVVFASCLFNNNDPVHKMSIDEFKEPDVGDDSGHAIGCDGHPPQVNLTWKPKDLKPTGQVTVYVDYTVPYTLDNGVVNVSLYFHGESEPFLGYANIFTCQQLRQYFALLPCPINKGMHIKTSRAITNLHALTSYPGTYDAVIQVLNDKKQEMFCFNATVHVNEI